ncbi:MAG: lipid II flippase MurJ [Acidobacteriota bacterium]
MCYVRNVAVAEIEERRAAHGRVFQNAAAVGVLTAVVKIAAAVKVAVTARYFGASDSLDAYLIAFLLPSFFVDTVAGTFTPSLVPGLIRERAHGQHRAGQLAQAGLFMVLGAMLPVLACLAIGGSWILPLLGASFSSEKIALTAVLFFSMLIWLPLGACSAAWRAVLNAHNHVALAVAVQLGAPLLTIALLAVGADRWGVWTLSAAVALGALTECVILGVAVRKLGYSLRPRWSGWTPEIRAVRNQYGPLLAGTMMVAGCGLVDQAVAASLGPGSVSTLSYGQKFASVLIAVAGTAWGTALLPEFSRLATAERWNTLRRMVRLHFLLALVLLTGAAIVMAWGSAELVRLMFQRGQFGPAEAVRVTEIQQVTMLLVPFAVTLMIMQRLATALSAAHLILRAGVAATAVNIAGDLLLPHWWGVRGVALASFAGHAIYLLGLLVLLYLKERRVFFAAEAH